MFFTRRFFTLALVALAFMLATTSLGQAAPVSWRPGDGPSSLMQEPDPPGAGATDDGSGASQGPEGGGILFRLFWSTFGNAGTDPSIQFLGTRDDVALEVRVNNERALRIEPTTDTPNLIGGYSGNSVTDGVVGATIGGGGAADDGFGNPVPSGRQ